MADLNGAEVSTSTEEVSASEDNSMSQEAQATDSAAEVLTRAAALSLRLGDFLEKLESRSTAAITALADSDRAKDNQRPSSDKSKEGQDNGDGSLYSSL